MKGLLTLIAMACLATGDAYGQVGRKPAGAPVALRISSGQIEKMIKEFVPDMPPLINSIDGEASVLLSAVQKAGQPERHTYVSHSYLVLSGNGAVLVGGTITAEKKISAGEFQGSRIEGGKRLPLRKGDLIWIPRGTPHLVIPGSGGVSMLVFRNHFGEK